jgi:subtilisin family serine protease
LPGPLSVWAIGVIIVWSIDVLMRILVPWFLSIIVILSLFPASAPATTPATTAALPGLYTHMLAQADQPSWVAAQQAQPHPVRALIHLDLAPFGIVGAGLTEAAAIAHQQALAQAQDRIAAQVIARGGAVDARLTHAAAALAITIPGSALADLRALPGVAAIQPINDLELTQTALTDGALTLAQLNTLIESRDVHASGRTGRGVAIAIVDSGVDYTHAKLGGPGTEEAYYRARCGGALLRPDDPSCDPRIDPPLDLFPNAKIRGGFDLLGDVWPNPDPTCNNQPCLRPDRNPIDLSGHGTAVADIVAGLPLLPDGSDAGVAYGAQLWAYKACNGGTGLCNGTAVLQAIDYAMDLDGSTRSGGCVTNCAAYDPADIIVVPASFRYGQPEDALSFLAEVATFYGSLVVAAAGNEGDSPYVVGAPAVAAGAIAVAESGFPVNAPFILRFNDAPLDALLQSWASTALTEVRSPLRYGNGDGTNLTGCAPLNATTGALLLDRNGCSTPIKLQNAVAAGATLVLIADTQLNDTPPALPGLATSIPVFTITNAAGTQIKAQLAITSGQVALTIPPPDLREQLASSSSRGPRIADGALKPDITAPGTIIAAQAGSQTGSAIFSGTSAATPVVAGVAALIIEELEARGLIDPAPGLRDQLPGSLSIAPLVKAVVINHADPRLLATPDNQPAPFTAQGAGRVNARVAYSGRVIAMDATATNTLFNNLPLPAECPINPFIDVWRLIVFRQPLPCAIEYPFGNELLRAWNGQVPNISFGYQAASGFQEYTRQLALFNYSLTPQTYQLSTAFRDVADQNRGVSIQVEPSQVTLAPSGITLITVTLQLSPSMLREGGLHNARGDGSCADESGANCANLTDFEVDARHQITVPWHVLPRRAAAVAVTNQNGSAITLSNPAVATAGRTEAFALVDVSPNKCDQRNGTTCARVDYLIGSIPGNNQSPLDLHLIGVRGRSVPGLNASFGLPATPPGSLADELVEFAITVHDRPYRAVPGVPARFAISVDVNRDGTMDFLIYTADANGVNDGRSAVYVRDINPTDGFTPERWYLLADADYNTQRWILPVPAAALGLRSDQPFAFSVSVFDHSFGGAAWDCSPRVNNQCTGVHIFQTGLPAYTTAQQTLTVAPQSNLSLSYSSPVGGRAASPAQIGLMLVFRDAVPGQEAAAVRLP